MTSKSVPRSFYAKLFSVKFAKFLRNRTARSPVAQLLASYVPMGAAQALDARPERLREEGDRHRDARQWGAAVTSYRAYLAIAPTDWPIIVQLGHCVKELGGPEEALGLYRKAELLAPGDPDLKVQIGHALKLLGHATEAIASYNAALRIAPAFEAAESELVADWASTPLADAKRLVGSADLVVSDPATQDILVNAGCVAEPGLPPSILLPDWDGPPPDATSPDAVLPGILLDVSDLVAHLAEARRPTGVQRVQIEVVRAVSAHVAPETAVVLAYLPESGTWHRLLPDLFQSLISHFEAPGASDAPMSAQDLRDAILAAPMMGPRSGQVLVALGACWALPGHARAVARAHPTLCNPGTVRDFATWFSMLGAGADGFLVNSRATESDLRRLQARHFGVLPQPIEIVPLNAARPQAGVTSNLPAAMSQRAIERPFVLAVGAFDLRNDYATLLDAWWKIASTAGNATPLLVCVGRRGWSNTAAIEAQIADPTLAPHVILLHDVDEAELDALYTNCLFTVCTSRHEGWGLPVTESIAHGRVPVVPAHSGLLESGTGCAAFYEPGDFDNLHDILARLCFDTSYRGALERSLLRHRRLRSWHEVAEQILAVAARVAEEPARPPIALLRAGAFAAFDGTDRNAPSLAAALPSIACTDGWGPPCERGVPFARSGAVLHLVVAVSDLEAGGLCRLFIGLRGGLAAHKVNATLTTETMPTPLLIQLRLHPGSLASVSFERDWPAGTHRIAISLEVDTLEPGADGKPAGWFVGIAFSGGKVLMRSRSFQDRLALAGANLPGGA
jgi:hypothetical protein